MESISALLVQRRRYKEPDLLDEFAALATTAGYSVIGEFDIVSPPSQQFGITSGKVEEIGVWIEVNNPEFVLFSPSLKSSQIYRLMEEWQVEVRDRTQVILEIFARQARTPQAKLQIEQARLRYELPFERHQIRMRLQKEHTGDRPIAEQIGAGEDLLNLRIRDIRRRLAVIDDKLEKIANVQALRKKHRSRKGFLEVTLAGYTNAGKSTLHRALTGSEVEVADELFTTLSTKAARLPVDGRKVVLSDSVGFISDLPPSLLKAFNTTLMEISDADVIVLVVDGSDSEEEMLRKVDACLETFTEIEVTNIPLLIALNKIDLIDKKQTIERQRILEDTVKQVIPISAAKCTNMDTLLEAISESLPQYDKYTFSIPYDDSAMSLMSWLHDVGDVISEKYEEDRIAVIAGLSPSVAQKLSKTLPTGAFKRVTQEESAA